MPIRGPAARSIIAALIAVAALGFALPKSALAQPVADFYRGKQLKVIIRAAPGGNYDLYLRLLARHIVQLFRQSRAA
jgi:tripartite-type tricarboxylate transporter receptor subunit TctC